MSTTGTVTAYTINILGPSQSIGQLAINPGSGVDDTLALAIATALNALTWPTGTSLQMQKDIITDVDYQVNFSVTPLAFT